MSVKQIVGVLLLIVGTLVLVYGGFTYTEETHDAEIGPLDLQVRERERVDIPVWAGVALIAAGAAVLLIKSKE